MRPSDITDGIVTSALVLLSMTSFNEAVGYYRRNPGRQTVGLDQVGSASMRPSDITDGIPSLRHHRGWP